MNLDDTLAALEALDQRKRFERWRYFRPIPKQEEFLAAGAQYPERMLMAGNGNGKTETAAYEISRHLTGVYPPWWKGYRFNGPVTVWVGSITGQQGREGAQTKLFGPPGSPEDQGSGFIPKEAIVRAYVSGRPANAIDTAVIKHSSGEHSRVTFKTYDQGRETWQGADINILWLDEEPPEEVLSEGLARLRGKGIFLMTFTPLKGRTAVVRRFKDAPHPLRHITYLRLGECSWMTEEAKARQVDQYPLHERAARINGEPMLGEGAVFTTPIEDLLEPSLSFTVIPDSWPRIWGLDFGIGHPFAAVLLAWDRDNDIVHLLREYRVKGAIPLQHAAVIKRMAANVPIAWPHDGTHREASSGEPLANEYRTLGLKMLDEHATFDGGGYSFETGILMLENRGTTGRLKVDQGMILWQQEYGSYHREKGLVVKVEDDLMSATRVGVMMLRRARCVPFGSHLVKPLRRRHRGDIDPWTGRPTGAPYGNSRNHHP
jgi:phage terminase large subunit-like protein